MRKYIGLFFIFFTMNACSDTLSEVNNEIKAFHETIKVQYGNKMGISIYYSSENMPKPTIYFLSASVSDRRVYEHIYYYLVKQGYTVVGLSTHSFASDFITYHFYDAVTYARKICKEKNISNEKKIGLAGHSSGAGVLPSLGYKLFVEDKLGEEGRFIFGAAPWIDFQHKKYMKLPKNTNFVTEVFVNDHSTDPRIALDMYKLMEVKHKSFMVVKKGANHQTPFYENPRTLIEKGVYEPLANLASFSFFKRDKEKIFPLKNIRSEYLDIEAEGTLPSDRVYKSMLRNFVLSRSSFGCVVSKNYIKNPREKECLAYVNRIKK